jgi:hypothetical protein
MSRGIVDESCQFTTPTKLVLIITDDFLFRKEKLTQRSLGL